MSIEILGDTRASFDGTAKANFTANLLRVGASQTVTVTFSVPLSSVGSHTIKVQFDVTNVIAESNESNNTFQISQSF